jgi:hypothetical protein
MYIVEMIIYQNQSCGATWRANKTCDPAGEHIPDAYGSEACVPARTRQFTGYADDTGQ